MDKRGTRPTSSGASTPIQNAQWNPPAAAPASYALVEWLFLRALGLIYLSAFVSLSVQMLGLIGSDGILPAAQYLQRARQVLGISAYWQVPTVFWINSSDGALLGACLTGMLLALLVVAGLAQRPALAGLFVLYLSFVSAGQTFLAYQWDNLLLEAGFLAIFLGLSPLTVLLFRWLLFRLDFMSGVVKLTSGDATWRSLTALDFHYETQPLPTIFAWFAQQQPEALHRLSVLGVFVVEIGLPFLIFAPRRLRFIAAGGILSLQGLIFLTGNYTFFNLLTAALCLFLLDDAALRHVVPASFWRWFTGQPARRPPTSRLRPNAGIVATVLAAIPILALSLAVMLRLFSVPVPEFAALVLEPVTPFRIANPYGLFAVMTTVRREIIIEGSNNGQTWLAYEFLFKPGDVRAPPRWAAPYQPRLDWQMWFAALGSDQDNPWFNSFILRLLQGSPSVLRLMQTNPFPAAPPRYVRALLYEYHFTDWPTLRSQGAWWRRDLVGVYLPPVSVSGP
jgi:hypothetical protein